MEKQSLSLWNYNSYEETTRKPEEYFIVEVSLPEGTLGGKWDPITGNEIKIGVNTALNASSLNNQYFAKAVVADVLGAANIPVTGIYDAKGATDRNIHTANFYIDNPMAENPTLTN